LTIENAKGEWVAFDKARVENLKIRMGSISDWAHGVYNTTVDQPMIKSRWLGRQFMVFKSWMPMVFWRRWSGSTWDANQQVTPGDQNAYTESYNNALGREVKNMLKVMRSPGHNMLAIRAAYLAVRNELSPEQKAAFNSAIMDNLIVTAFTSLLTAVLAGIAMGGDPDDDKRWWMKTAKYFIDRAQYEHRSTNFMGLVPEAMNTVDNSFVLWSFIKDNEQLFNYAVDKFTGAQTESGKPKDIYQRGKYKGQSKFKRQFTKLYLSPYYQVKKFIAEPTPFVKPQDINKGKQRQKKNKK